MHSEIIFVLEKVTIKIKLMKIQIAVLKFCKMYVFAQVQKDVLYMYVTFYKRFDSHFRHWFFFILKQFWCRSTTITVRYLCSYIEWATKKVARLPFSTCPCYCINFCIYAMLRTRATFSWPTLCYWICWFSSISFSIKSWRIWNKL